MSKEYLYYKVTGGAVQAAYDRWRATYDTQREVRNELLLEFGSSGCYASPQHVVGLVFTGDSKPPAGWKAVIGEPTVFRPHGGAVGMKAIRKRFEAAKLNDAEAFQAEVLGKHNPFHFMDGLSIRFMVFEFIGKTLVLLVPKLEQPREGTGEGRFTPPDDQCVLMKTSEYWQLKELLAESVKEK